MDQEYIGVVRRDPCAYCGASGGCIDHIDPTVLGGADDESNVVAACRHCNSTKGGKLLLAFLVYRRWQHTFTWGERTRWADLASHAPQSGWSA